MKPRTLFAAPLAMALAVGLAACGLSVDDVCGRLADDCQVEDADACSSDGVSIETRAEELGCGAEFDDYLVCLDDAGCSWRNQCGRERHAVEACVGPFPDDEN